MYGRVFFSEVFSPTNFSHKLTGIIQHCTFVYWIFHTNWREWSNTIFCSPNFSHKLTGIIQHYILFTKFFPTNGHDFFHKPTWFFPQTNMNFSKNCSHLDLNLRPFASDNPLLSSQPLHPILIPKKSIWILGFGEDYKYTARLTGTGGCKFES